MRNSTHSVCYGYYSDVFAETNINLSILHLCICLDSWFKGGVPNARKIVHTMNLFQEILDSYFLCVGLCNQGHRLPYLDQVLDRRVSNVTNGTLANSFKKDPKTGLP